ncbi:MAG: hypothetical protein CVV44_10995 [Spirochaetae bacterium HGW-Spirochaetae-1]|nr:MAG: hypothetical protein CVV44_10995 [Spirochaetae bacterium HGW-Spirochaetae-1]
MIQNITTIIIIALAALYALWKLIRFVRRPDESACTPEKCSTCTMKGPGCEEKITATKDRG